jgi:[lysine-biosynthesis-protein LysW]--L-2-aminoadipate ligase
MTLALVARRETETNRALVAAAPVGLECRLLSPEQALLELGPGDAALCRLDVLATLDGVDDGLWALGSLEAAGVRVLNPASALLAAHDKLLTARLLRRAGLPHPRTRVLQPGDPIAAPDGPVVVKPRFGSWGRGVVRCDDEVAFRRHIRSLASTPWFCTHGALMQDLVPTLGRDLRIVVAGGGVVGAISRVAQPGEWRTNVSLGALRVPVVPSREACDLAVECAAATGADLIGVDLLPDGRGSWAVLELNGAVEFSDEYAVGSDPFGSAMWQLARAALGCAPTRSRRGARVLS